MTIKPERYSRKPFEVDAVQVTKENINEVAKWCQGEVLHAVRVTQKDGAPNTDSTVPYIKVRVHRPLNERQTKAFVGDWILYAGTGYKVYTPKAFINSFERNGSSPADQALAHLGSAVDKPVVANVAGTRVHLKTVEG